MWEFCWTLSKLGVIMYNNYYFQPHITIRSSVSNTGPYIFLAHYYQPQYVGFDVNVDVVVENKGYSGIIVIYIDASL